MKIHEYQAKELFRKNGVAVPDGAVAFTVEEAKGGCRQTGRIPGGGESPDPCRRPRSGRRCQGRQDPRRIRRFCQQHSGDEPGHQTDGTRGQTGQETAHRAGSEHRQGALPEHPAGPRHGQDDHHGQRSRRHGHRRCGRKDPEKIIKVYVDPNVGIQGYHCGRRRSGSTCPRRV
jgi:succinyl-CoA synthetase beta subunit